MRIVIDMQGVQSTGNRNRGIGRYTLALSKEIVRLRGEHKVILALNGLFPDTIKPIREAFAGLLPEENICVWEAVGPVSATDKANDLRRQVAEISRETFLASLQPDIVLITSLFEGLGDDAITSIGRFVSCLPTAVILYDLIPFIHREIYLVNPIIEQWYLNKLAHLRCADLLISISASSGQEAVDYLGFSKEKVVNISAACDNHYRPKKVGDAEYMYLQKAYGLTRPFVMYTGGIDHRKNIEGLIRAYAGMAKHLRVEHQLVVVCSIQAPDRKRLLKLADKKGLKKDELVITGFVSEDDLLIFYNTCKLFVFPSWHEGFGLPVLEAMACGRAVIGSNTSSVPEVIGREDVLFDPFDHEAITRKMEDVLINDDYRAALERHGLTQANKFSWERTARRAWQALEDFVLQRLQKVLESALPVKKKRPRLAYISPLPPEQSGIANYSAELLPELSRHYEIEVVVQNEVSDPWVCANCPIRSVDWFHANANSFDRILYHFGNSAFHSHMFDLINEIRGVVVLHDFFLSGIVNHMDSQGQRPDSFARALIHSHGWPAFLARYRSKDIADVVWTYPCNLEVLQQALGVIVHSEHSRRLACKWYGPDAADHWAVIPLLRAPAIKTDRQAARRKLRAKESEFIVCSFGMQGPTKLNHRLLAAWLASPLANDPHCRLIFVGENQGSEYGVQLQETIRASGLGKRILISGWVDMPTFHDHLTAADIAVQLRTRSRGETSATVLDCMNHGLATVVNAHGSMADLPTDAVWMLPDEFSDKQLIEALTILWHSAEQRNAFGRRAREEIHAHHQPRRCAEQYTEAIESYYQKAALSLPALIDSVASIETSLSEDDLQRLATTLANNHPPQPRPRQLFLDISELVQRDVRSGIQRVVRALLKEFLLKQPDGWMVMPVYASADTKGYRYARHFISRFLGVNDAWAEDDLVDAYQGDIFLGLDLQPVVVSAQKDCLLGWQRRGVKIFFVVYDLLPILFPQYFWAGAQPLFEQWLKSVSNFDGAICISRAVADELAVWHQNNGQQRLRPLKIAWFHLGSDIDNSVPTRGLTENANHVIEELTRRPSFLIVGTIEPRKGYSQILGAFERLWKHGINVNLVIIGKQGWKVELLVKKLRKHAEQGQRLFWLEDVSDEYLEKIYAVSTCLIAASEGEGFGLPLIEVAQHKIPIIARDIPVFREVAGEHAFYFNGLKPQALTGAVQQWLELNMQGKVPRSDDMPILTWKQSAEQLIKIVLNG
jgi:glycosyltransferase involved in cell wall biosynthesis